MLLARSAIERGMQLVAGMLTIIGAQEARRQARSDRQFQLVSWCSEARSRREDELARSQQSKVD
jgi:hypothetical protein